MQLNPGEFIGQTVESSIPYFRAKTKLSLKATQYSIASFVKVQQKDTLGMKVKQNFWNIRNVVASIVKRYPNVYRSSE
ncbi:MAG: hypothetical protein AAF223_06735 [Bacteroidota bacterium]